MKSKLVLLFAAFLFAAGLASGQTWVVEQIDSTAADVGVRPARDQGRHDHAVALGGHAGRGRIPAGQPGLAAPSGQQQERCDPDGPAKPAELSTHAESLRPAGHVEDRTELLERVAY